MSTDDLPDVSRLTRRQRQELIERAMAEQVKDLAATLARLRKQFDAICADEGVTLTQVFTGQAKGIVPITHADRNGNTWSGRGKTPRWITNSGKPADYFRLDRQQPEDGPVDRYRKLNVPSYDKHPDNPLQALKEAKRR